MAKELGEESISLLISKTVLYSITKQEVSTGKVLDKVLMAKPKDTFSTTGYMIEDNETKELKPIEYWRVLKIVNPPLKGGYNRKIRDEQ